MRYYLKHEKLGFVKGYLLGLVLFDEELPRMYFKDVVEANQFKNEFPYSEQSQLTVIVEPAPVVTENAN
jgi:hypothetical protein